MNEDQSITYPSGESLGDNFYMIHYERIRKYPHQYEPQFGADRDWNSDTVNIIVGVIQSGDLIEMYILMRSYL